MYVLDEKMCNNLLSVEKKRYDNMFLVDKS